MKRAIIVMLILCSVFPRLLICQEIDIDSLLGEEWYGVYMNGQKTGWFKSEVTKNDNGSVEFNEEVVFRIKMLGNSQEMQSTSKRVYSADGDLEHVASTVSGAGMSQNFEATVQGDIITVTKVVGGQTTSQDLPNPNESLNDALKQMRLVKGNPQIGDSISYAQFDPQFGISIDAVSTLEDISERVFDGVRVKVFKIKSTMKQMGISSIAYVDEEGKVLEDIYAGIMTIRLEPKEIAMDVDYTNDVIISNAAKVDRPIKNAKDRKFLRLRLSGPLTEDHMFNDGQQTLFKQGETFVFERKLVELDGFGAAILPIIETSVIQWTKPSTFVQSGDQQIIKKAQSIIGDEKDSLKVSKLLCNWVSGNMQSTYSASMSNTLDVLRTLEGDCTEHSILFVGLARAAGIPAREVAGLVYSEEGEPAFYFHQWAKVWVGKWIEVDPTFDQPIADVTHIKLSEGDLLEQTRLVPVIGRIKVEVLENP